MIVVIYVNEIRYNFMQRSRYLTNQGKESQHLSSKQAHIFKSFQKIDHFTKYTQLNW